MAKNQSHPHVVGSVSDHKIIGPEGRGEAKGNGDPTHPSTTSFGFGGRSYAPTGKKGASMHDQTPVHEFEAEDGHRVWADKAGRVHADSTSEVDALRKIGSENPESTTPENPKSSSSENPESSKGEKGAKSGPSAKDAKEKPMRKALFFTDAPNALKDAFR